LRRPWRWRFDWQDPVIPHLSEKSLEWHLWRAEGSRQVMRNAGHAQILAYVDRGGLQPSEKRGALLLGERARLVSDEPRSRLLGDR